MRRPSSWCKKGGKTVIAGDGQVSLGQTIIKGNARKVRRLGKGQVIVGFAGATADAFTLLRTARSQARTISRPAVARLRGIGQGLAHGPLFAPARSDDAGRRQERGPRPDRKRRRAGARARGRRRGHGHRLRRQLRAGRRSRAACDRSRRRGHRPPLACKSPSEFASTPTRNIVVESIDSLEIDRRQHQESPLHDRSFSPRNRLRA